MSVEAAVSARADEQATPMRRVLKIAPEVAVPFINNP
jgi:hypothetical protein